MEKMSVSKVAKFMRQNGNGWNNDQFQCSFGACTINVFFRNSILGFKVSCHRISSRPVLMYSLGNSGNSADFMVRCWVMLMVLLTFYVRKKFCKYYIFYAENMSGCFGHFSATQTISSWRFILIFIS